MNRIKLTLVLFPVLLIAAGCASSRNEFASARSDERSQVFDLGVDRPPTPQTLYNLARVLAIQGRDGEARYVLQKLLIQHPEFVPAYCELAELHMRAGHIERAEESLNRGLEISPDDARLIGNLGMCAMIRGEYDEALTLFGKAADLDPEDARHRSNMAVALGLMGRYDESFSLFEQVVPPSAAHYNVGVLAEARQDLKRSRREFERARALNPSMDYPEAP